MNCFTFIVIPILATVNPNMDFQAFYNARCQENVQLILDRISPAADKNPQPSERRNDENKFRQSK